MFRVKRLNSVKLQYFFFFFLKLWHYIRRRRWIKRDVLSVDWNACWSNGGAIGRLSLCHKKINYRRINHFRSLFGSLGFADFYSLIRKNDLIIPTDYRQGQESSSSRGRDRFTTSHCARYRETRFEGSRFKMHTCPLVFQKLCRKKFHRKVNITSVRVSDQTRALHVRFNRAIVQFFIFNTRYIQYIVSYNSNVS